MPIPHRFIPLNFVLILSLLLPLSAMASGNQAGLEDVDNELAGAYQAIQNDDLNKAENSFIGAAQNARQIQDWQGLTDAAFGLAALGKFNEAYSLFSEALTVAKVKESWQGLIAVGYGLSSLPENSVSKSQIFNCFNDAALISQKQEDWRGVVEAAKAFNEFNNQGRTNELLEIGTSLVTAAGDPTGAMTISKIYTNMGNSAKAAQLQALADQLNRGMGGETRTVKAPPPPDWNPVGKSVRDPNKVPEQAQQLNRASVDKDINNKMDYIRQQEQLKAERERNRTRLAEAYLYYSGYYGYPGRYFGIRNFGLYGFGLHPLSRSHLHSFASFHLSRFSRRGGFFIRADRHRYFH